MRIYGYDKCGLSTELGFLTSADCELYDMRTEAQIENRGCVPTFVSAVRREVPKPISLSYLLVLATGSTNWYVSREASLFMKFHSFRKFYAESTTS